MKNQTKSKKEVSSGLFPKLKKKEMLILAVIAVIFSAVCMAGFGLEFSDQNVYYYMGKLITEGKAPYVDFFFSHPPGEIYIDALIYGIFGFSLFAFKLSSLIAILGTAFLIYLTMRKYFNSLSGYIASGIFLFTYETIRIASGNIGMAFTIFFAVFGVYLVLENRNLAGGIFLGLSALMTLHAVPIIAAVMLYSLIEIKNSRLKLKLKSFGKTLGGFVLAFGIPNIIILIIAGNQYLSEVIGYHLLKPSAVVSGVKSGLFWLMAKYNILVFVIPLLIFFSGFRKEENKKVVYLGLIIIAVYIVYLIVLPGVFPYYYFGIFPFLAIIAGFSVYRFTEKKNVNNNIKKAVIAIISIALLANLWFAASQYYWTMNNTLKGDAITNLNSKIGDNKVIFGDYLFVPIISLENNNRIASEIVDTNPLRFQTGSLNANEIISQLKKEKEVYIIVRQSNNFLLAYDASKNYLNNDCSIIYSEDYSLPSYFEKQLVTDKLFLLKCGK